MMQQSTDLQTLLRASLPPPRVGKVRDAYQLGRTESGGQLRLSRASKRRSIFDFPLGFEIPQQGEMLTAMDLFFRYRLDEEMPDYGDDLIASGSGMDQFLPLALRGIPELQKTAIVVEEQLPPNIESVVRYILTGTGYKAYARGESICGHRLPPGLRDGSVIPGGPIWTPTTKAEKGHDLALNYEEVNTKKPGVQQASLELFNAIWKIADNAGYVEVDGKFEGSYVDEKWRWCDERGTTDSSRYVSKAAYQKQFVEEGGTLPSSKDKEILRKAGKKLGIDKLDPLKDEDRQHVLSLHFPPEVLDEMQAASNEIFEAFTGHTLKQFQKEVMDIRI